MFSKYLSTALISLATLRSVHGASTPKRRATCAGGQSVQNEACCVWFPVLEDILPNMFDNECGDDAHGALRLAFHDAIGFSPSKGGGGADGSIIVFNNTELTFPANSGLDDPINVEVPFIQAHNVTPGDFIQFAAAVSLSLCPGAPKAGFMMGRPLPVAPAPGPDGLIPEPFDNVQVILARMADAGGFTPTDVVALLASHSVAGADTVDPTIPGTPFDSTPELFDTQLFIEVQLRGTQFPGRDPGQGEVLSAVAGEMRLQSDHLIARDSATSCAWQSFAGNQAAMQSAFAKAFNKLAIIGHNPANLIDCSDVIPGAPPLPASMAPHLPAGQTQKNIEQACAASPFPTFTAQPGPATTVPAIPQS
ncbi:manganese dependent peroxidase 1 [Mycena albidolilacea]|uniref:Peroxidase n=1 Tax=Mycena albidolilacea TaxID=1033008 RepID=A0AAD6Z3Z3_9AGAR|nr:manganese dependent peroxidase 1 [Mycena albidolilacea]